MRFGLQIFFFLSARGDSGIQSKGACVKPEAPVRAFPGRSSLSGGECGHNPGFHLSGIF